MPIKDKSKYHPRWDLLSRLIRFKRAGNVCEWCAARNGHPHPDTGSVVVLTVAHLDQDPGNNKESNLAALCQRCHLNWDRDHHNKKLKYGYGWKKDQLAMFEIPVNLESPNNWRSRMGLVHLIKIQNTLREMESRDVPFKLLVTLKILKDYSDQQLNIEDINQRIRDSLLLDKIQVTHKDMRDYVSRKICLSKYPR